MVIPFGTGRYPALERARVLIRGHRLASTIRLRDPAIVRLPDGTELDKHVILGDGSGVVDPGLVLRGKR